MQALTYKCKGINRRCNMKIMSRLHSKKKAETGLFKTEQMRYYALMKKKLQTEYQLNILEDVILSQDDTIILFVDLNNKTITLELVSGSLETIGFGPGPTLDLETLFTCFDYNNGYAKVAGQNDYYASVYDEVHDFEHEPNVTFPIVNQNGKHWIRFHLVPLKNKPYLATVFITNVTQFLDEEEALYVKTHHDSLTGVFNKYTLDYHYGQRYKRDDFHVLFLDLDDFKVLNDEKGHKAGNNFLIDFTKILRTHESDINRFYRVGGDEFVGMFFEKEEQIKTIASNIIEETMVMSKKHYEKVVSVSIGIIQADAREDVIAKADKVLYEAKSKGKNQYIYTRESDL